MKPALHLCVHPSGTVTAHMSFLMYGVVGPVMSGPSIPKAKARAAQGMIETLAQLDRDGELPAALRHVTLT